MPTCVCVQQFDILRWKFSSLIYIVGTEQQKIFKLRSSQRSKNNRKIFSSHINMFWAYGAFDPFYILSDFNVKWYIMHVTMCCEILFSKWLIWDCSARVIMALAARLKTCNRLAAKNNNNIGRGTVYVVLTIIFSISINGRKTGCQCVNIYRWSGQNDSILYF